jgi:hypothetical protein
MMYWKKIPYDKKYLWVIKIWITKVYEIFIIEKFMMSSLYIQLRRCSKLYIFQYFIYSLKTCKSKIIIIWSNQLLFYQKKIKIHFFYLCIILLQSVYIKASWLKAFFVTERLQLKPRDGERFTPARRSGCPGFRLAWKFWQWRCFCRQSTKKISWKSHLRKFYYKYFNDLEIFVKNT